MNRFYAFAASAALAISGMAFAEEEIADLQARIASLEAKMMAPATSGDAESLMSLRKKGQVKIGGKVELNLRMLRRDEVDVDSWQNVGEAQPHKQVASTAGEIQQVRGGDTFNYTTWDWEGGLDLRVDINADTYAFIGLDLEDADDADDLVEKIGLTFKKVRGSNWDITIGKTGVPFGQATNHPITNSFVSGGGSIMNDHGTMLMDGLTTLQAANTGLTPTPNRTADNPHTRVGFAQPGNIQADIDNTQMVSATYKYKNQLKLDLTSFQNADAQMAATGTMGMHEDKSADQFQSYAARLTYTPIETLETSVSFMNAQKDTGGDNEVTRTDYSDNFSSARALSLAFTYDIKAIKTQIFGEYLHNWNMGYEEIDADVWQLGAKYKFSPKIDMGIMYEIADFDNDQQAAQYDNPGTLQAEGALGENQRRYKSQIDERYQRINSFVGYTTDSGVSFNVEYIYEWYTNDLGWYNDADGHQISFQTVYKF